MHHYYLFIYYFSSSTNTLRVFVTWHKCILLLFKKNQVQNKAVLNMRIINEKCISNTNELKKKNKNNNNKTIAYLLNSGYTIFP